MGDYAFPWLDESGNLIGSVGILSNIRERKRGEEALLESNRFLRATLDALSANIALLDEQGTILLVNKAWLEP